MIQKSKIIENAFLMLGSNDTYNDNKSKEYKIANQLLNKISVSILGETDFLFSSITTKLTSIGKNELGEYRFNIPEDFLGIVRAKDLCRLEGEFIFSKASELFLQYGRKLPLEEFPAYAENLLMLGLAKELSIAISAYNDRYQIIKQQYEDEKVNMLYKIGTQYNAWEE